MHWQKWLKTTVLFVLQTWHLTMLENSTILQSSFYYVCRAPTQYHGTCGLFHDTYMQYVSQRYHRCSLSYDVSYMCAWNIDAPISNSNPGKLGMQNIIWILKACCFLIGTKYYSDVASHQVISLYVLWKNPHNFTSHIYWVPFSNRD